MTTPILDRDLAPLFLRVVEAGALAAARWMGQGDNMAADRAAVEAIRAALGELPLWGTVVIGEGERDQAPMLYIGEEVGDPAGPAVDIAVDPLEGTNLIARGQNGALAVIAAAERGGLLHAPDTYMEKLIVGPPAVGKVRLEFPVEANLRIIADSLRRDVGDLTVVILDRPRHTALVEQVRAAGARIKLIEDGDLAAAISVAVAGTGDHAVMGTGGAPEGVLAAAALRCLGGEVLGRFVPRDAAEAERCRAMGVDPGRVYTTTDLASGGQIVFACTGVTDGDLFRGVHFFGGGARTHSLVMSAPTRTIRFIDAVHVFDPRALGSVRIG
ncbi:MAG TPA: class II fructose-bisphosphatase [Chloroflexota bacterium]|nr:class II fructose-bisphosphatase [Chloroflexota bacterium]